MICVTLVDTINTLVIDVIGQLIRFIVSTGQRYTNHLTQKKTCTLRLSNVNVISNSPSQDYTHPDDRTLLNYDMTPGFKLFMFLELLHLSLNFLIVRVVHVLFRGEISQCYTHKTYL